MNTLDPDNPQNPCVRRVYLMRPRSELVVRLEALGLADDAEFLSQPTVVMTEPLPYEDKLEGYRSLILRKCKEAFLEQLRELEPLHDELHRTALLGSRVDCAETFDQWWTAEEVETLEIPTTW